MSLTDKYSYTKDAYVREAKSDIKDRITIEVGDSKQAKFYPQIKIMRWDNEVNLSIRLADKDNSEPIVLQEDGKIKYKKSKIECHFYDTPVTKQSEDGGDEFEIILLEKPDFNVFEFTLNTKGIEFIYCPPLTNEEIAEGCRIEENCIGSYAVYHRTKSNNFTDKHYKTGKICQIYRPKINDSAGNWAWGKLTIDSKGDEALGTLTVEIPQTFLDNAVYPVYHATGLDFGYTSKGTYGAHITSRYQASMFAIGANANAVSMSCYITQYSTHTPPVKLGIYDDLSTYPNNRIDTSDAWTVTAGWDNWKTLNMNVGASLTNGSNYWLTFANYKSTDSEIYYYYELTGGTVKYKGWDGVNTPLVTPFPASGSSMSRKVSIYCTYNVASTGTLPPFPFLRF